MHSSSTQLKHKGFEIIAQTLHPLLGIDSDGPEELEGSNLINGALPGLKEVNNLRETPVLASELTSTKDRMAADAKKASPSSLPLNLITFSRVRLSRSSPYCLLLSSSLPAAGS